MNLKPKYYFLLSSICLLTILACEKNKDFTPTTNINPLDIQEFPIPVLDINTLTGSAVTSKSTYISGTLGIRQCR